MLDNQTINPINKNNDFYIYHNVEDLQSNYMEFNNTSNKHIEEIMTTSTFNTLTKQSRDLYRSVESIVKDFDRQYDNTVLDTYTFERVLSSTKIINAIYYYTCISTLNHDELIEVKEAIASYILLEVAKSYQNNNHIVFQPQLYYDYIRELFYRVYFQLNTH